MYEWKKGDLGIAGDYQYSRFTPGTVVRCEEDIGSWETCYWSIIFGPTPADTQWRHRDTGLWIEFAEYIDPLPDGERNGGE